MDLLQVTTVINFGMFVKSIELHGQIIEGECAAIQSKFRDSVFDLINRYCTPNELTLNVWNVTGGIESTWRKLRKLTFCNCKFGTSSAHMLSLWPPEPELRELHFSDGEDLRFGIILRQAFPKVVLISFNHIIQCEKR